jgi:hypothetical protein
MIRKREGSMSLDVFIAFGLFSFQWVFNAWLNYVLVTEYSPTSGRST